MTRRLTSQIFISFIFLLLSLFVYHLILYSNGQKTSAKNHIIRFFEYKKAEDLKEYLERNVKLKGWKWVERQNPAMKFPTDFALVMIEERISEFLIRELGKLELVKDVSLDLSYQRGVLEEEEDKIAAFLDGRKRPGKMFTSMSFPAARGDNHGAIFLNTNTNTSSWRRRNLMMQIQMSEYGDSNGIILRPTDLGNEGSYNTFRANFLFHDGQFVIVSLIFRWIFLIRLLPKKGLSGSDFMMI